MKPATAAGHPILSQSTSAGGYIILYSFSYEFQFELIKMWESLESLDLGHNSQLQYSLINDRRKLYIVYTFFIHLKIRFKIQNDTNF